ncbi:Ig-like domain-containing protein [Paenibacillus sp. NFR01]|uniref:Ig-like domain-containing protein n=1 Tax=Paenibacillus sp. NFR01 TaxID=1566279 RepID=UPI0015874181|nr:Ig-like domain-containing protein [Paenibacillus sp. NFR01]
MSNMSYPTKENTQFMNVQGGEKKVMKKILSVALSTAMAFSMFASVAFADTTTTATPQQAFEALAAKGILNGYPDGQAHLEKDLTRAEFAKIVSKLFDLKEVTGKLSYKDKGYTATNWAVPYIEAVTAANLMQGKDTVKGIFDYNGKVTVEEVSAVLFRALKLETPATTDNSASAWAKGYAQAVINAGLIAKDTNFKANATRQLVVQAAYQVATLQTKPAVVSAKAISPTSVEVTFDDKTTTTVTPAAALVEGVPTNVAFTYKGFSYSVSVTLAAPAVTSVSIVNSKQLKIQFNSPVNTDTVLDANGELLNNVVTLDGTALVAATSDASFDDAKLVLTVTLTTGLVKDTEHTLTVDNVQNAQAVKFPRYSVAFKAAEAVVPSIKSLTSVTKNDVTRNVTIEFTEPVSFNSIKVNGKFVSGVATADSNYGAKYTLTTSEDLTTGQTYSVEVNGLKDGFNNLAQNIITTSVAVVRDTVKPTFTVAAVNEKTLDVKFDKSMSSSVAVDSFTVTYVDVTGATKTAVQTQLPTLKSDGKTFRITLATDVFEGNTSLTTKDLKVAVANVADTLGNVVDSKTATVTINRDATKPTISAVKVVPGTSNTLTVDFSEPVTGIAPAAFALTDANGNDVKTSAGTTITVATAVAADSDTATLTLSASLPATGTYKLVLKQDYLSDNATVANKNAAQVVSFTFTKAAATVNQVYATISNSLGGGVVTSSTQADRRVVVTFTEPDVIHGLSNSTGTYLDGAADNAANYTLDGVALPAGTTVTFAGTTATIDFTAVAAANLPTALKQGGNIGIGVSNVKTAAGSTLGYTTATVAVKDTTAPTVSGAFLTGDVSSNTVKLTVVFSEAVDITAIDATKFSLTDGTNTAAFDSAVVGTDSSRVEFTFTAAPTLDATKTITLAIAAANGVKDKAATPVALGTAAAVAVTNYATN